LVKSGEDAFVRRRGSGHGFRRRPGAGRLGVDDEYAIEEGKAAHLVVFDAPTPVEVRRLQPVRRWVIRSGRVIAETTPPSTRLFHEGREETITFAPPATGV